MITAKDARNKTERGKRTELEGELRFLNDAIVKEAERGNSVVRFEGLLSEEAAAFLIKYGFTVTTDMVKMHSVPYYSISWE